MPWAIYIEGVVWQGMFGVAGKAEDKGKGIEDERRHVSRLRFEQTDQQASEEHENRIETAMPSNAFSSL